MANYIILHMQKAFWNSFEAAVRLLGGACLESLRSNAMNRPSVWEDGRPWGTSLEFRAMTRFDRGH